MPSKKPHYRMSAISPLLAKDIAAARQRIAQRQAQQQQGQGLPNYYDLKEAMANAPKQEPPDEGLAGFGEYVGKAWLGGGLTGTLSELVTGEPVFDEPSTYQPNKVEQFIGGAAEFASPADLLAMFLGAGVGGKIAGAAIKEGASAALGKVATSALTSAGGFAAQSGAREAAESKLETGSVDIPGTLMATAKGGAVGAIAGAAGTAAGLPFAKSKLQTFAETAGEIAGFGTAVPVIEEGRSPEVNDYLQAGYAIAAFKLATFPLNRRKAVADKVIAEESEYVKQEVARTGKTINEVLATRLADVNEGAFNREALLRIGESSDGAVKNQSIVDGFPVEKELTVGDVLTGKKLREMYKPILDKKIEVDNTDASVGGKFDPTNPGVIKVSTTKDGVAVPQEEILYNLLHEGGHARRVEAGIKLPEVDAKTLTPEEYLQQPSEQAARRLAEYAAKQSEPIDKQFNISRVNVITEGAKKQFKGRPPEAVLTVSDQQGTKGASYELHNVGEAKQLKLTSASDYRAVERVIAEAKREKANLYFDTKLEKSPIFKSLQKQGRISEQRAGKFYRLTDNVKVPETNQPQNVAYSLRLDALAAGRKGTPEARKSVVDMLQNNIDKVFDRIRQTPLGGFLQAKNRFTSKTANTEYIPTIRRADNHRNRLMGQWLERANALGINAKMSEADGIKLSYAIEKGNSPEINKFLRELHDYATSESVGMKLGKIENYFPRVLKKEVAEKLFDDVIELQKEIATVPATDANNAVANALKSKSKYVQDAVAAVMSENPGTSYTQALKFLNSQTQNRLFNRSGFEFKRKLKLPADFYERDARKVIPEYIVDLSSRVAQSKFFGQDGEKAMAMINKIGAESPKERRLAHELFQQWSGAIKSDPSRVYSGNTRAFLNAYTNYEVLTKIGLGTATVANAWQPLISFIPKHGAWRSIRAAMDLATDADYRAKVRRSGAIDQDVIHALLGMQPEGALAKLTDKVTTYSGFRPINRLWQYWSAATMDKAVTDWHRIAQGKGARAEWAQKNLKDFDIDYRKPVTEDARLEAMSRFANESQLQKNYLNDPLIFNDPKFAPLFLFKRFGYRQGAYLKDMLWEEVKRGNAAPILRLGAGGALGGALAIGSFNAIQSALSGQPVPDKSDSWFGEAVDMTAAIGMVGIYSDVARMWDMQDKSKIARRVALPVGWGDVEKFAQALTDVDRDWQTYGDAWLVTKRNTHHLANIPGGMIGQASSRLLTDKQKSDKLKYAHTQQKNRVMKLIVEGNGTQAASVIREWNARANEAPLTRDDINSKELREYMERKLTQLAEAKGYDKKTKEGREYLRGQRKEMLQQYKLSRQNLPPRQEMPR